MNGKCDNCGARVPTGFMGAVEMCACSGQFCSEKCSREWHSIEPSKRKRVE